MEMGCEDFKNLESRLPTILCQRVMDVLGVDSLLQGREISFIQGPHEEPELSQRATTYFD